MSEDNELPPELQDAKRELIKLGMEQGYVTQSQVREYLPVDHLTPGEVDLLEFTFDTMGIEVRKDEDQ